MRLSGRLACEAKERAREVVLASGWLPGARSGRNAFRCAGVRIAWSRLRPARYLSCWIKVNCSLVVL